MKKSFIIGLLLISPSPAIAEEIPGFLTPDKNISCGYLVGGKPLGIPRTKLVCEIYDTIWNPPAPTDCEYDLVKYAEMESTGTAKGAVNCLSGAWIYDGINTLSYGQDWKIKEFACTSTAAHLRCENESHHGWEMSKTGVRFF